MKNLVEIKEVHKSYLKVGEGFSGGRLKVLEGVSFNIEEGLCVGLIFNAIKRFDKPGQAQGAWGLARVRCGARVTGAAAPSNPCLPAAAVPRRRSAGLAYAQALRPDAARSTLA